MSLYNKPFFSLLENIYLVLSSKFAQEEAVSLFESIMCKGLAASYGQDFKKGSPETFVELVGARDQAVGLDVAFPEVSSDKIIYQFHTDPMPNLKGVIDQHTLDNVYMAFKVRYILGDDWSYRTTRHFWSGDQYSEHIITKGI